VSGDGKGFGKGELFDLVSEVGDLRLTAMTRIEWGGDRSLAEVVLFAIADGASHKEVAKQVGVSVQKVTAIVRKSGEEELAGHD
jgi:hypothetical protein